MIITKKAIPRRTVLRGIGAGLVGLGGMLPLGAAFAGGGGGIRVGMGGI